MSNDRFFLIRLLAPRATFMQDMTEDPAVQPIPGMHYEVLPMLTAVFGS